MRNQKGYVAGYNGQLVVTAQQVIVGAVLSQHPVDRTLLHPVLDTCRQQLAEAGIGPKLCTVLADSGYVTEDNFAHADTDGLRLLAPLAKDPDGATPARHSGPGTWTCSPPPRAPSGGCAITGAAPITSSVPRPSSRCSDRSSPA
jgi:Transposase DDE domain